MAATQDLSWYRGEDVTLAVTLSPTTDITGWTLSFKVKQNATDATALLTVAGSITGAAAGTFSVSLTAAQTASVPTGVYVYDIWRTDSGAATALTVGSVTVKNSPRVP